MPEVGYGKKIASGAQSQGEHHGTAGFIPSL
jgi:hypothetical protein